MNKSVLFSVSFIVSLILFTQFASASCSLGANPLSMDLSAKPGQEVMVSWNLYNLYGDRTTHVAISKVAGPDWKIRYEPALQEQKYNISGIIEKVMENVALENMQVVPEIPSILPAGVSYVKHPKEAGYIPVRAVKIYVTIPKDAKLWETSKFEFEAKGTCFSEPGAVVPAVATKLNLNIRATTDFYEAPVTNVTEEKPGVVSITGAIIGTNLLPGILLLVTLVLLLVLYLLIRIKRRLRTKRKSKKESRK